MRSLPFLIVCLCLCLCARACRFAGYDTGACKQPPPVVYTLKLLIGAAPVAFIITGLMILLLYPISEDVRLRNKVCLDELRWAENITWCHQFILRLKTWQPNILGNVGCLWFFQWCKMMTYGDKMFKKKKTILNNTVIGRTDVEPVASLTLASPAHRKQSIGSRTMEDLSNVWSWSEATDSSDRSGWEVVH